MKNRNKMEGRRPEGHSTYTRNTRMGETSRRQRRMDASSEGGQGPERDYSAVDGWIDMFNIYYQLT